MQGIFYIYKKNCPQVCFILKDPSEQLLRKLIYERNMAVVPNPHGGVL